MFEVNFTVEAIKALVGAIVGLSVAFLAMFARNIWQNRKARKLARKGGAK